MNKDELKGSWHQLKGKIKEKWGELTDDDITQIQGKRDQLLGRLQERYGWEKREAEDELRNFEKATWSKREEFPRHNRDQDQDEGRKHRKAR
jgi:uncharacterized protein YjbJ (UPF0337 family)